MIKSANSMTEVNAKVNQFMTKLNRKEFILRVSPWNEKKFSHIVYNQDSKHKEDKMTSMVNKL